MKESIKILEELSGNIISENNLTKAVKIMSSKEIKDTIFNFLKLAEKDSKELSKDEMNFLKALIHVSNSIYNYSGENTGMSDSEYDILSEYYKKISGDDVLSEKVVGDNLSYHKFPSLRGTLDKIYKLTDEDVLKNKSQSSIEDWIKTAETSYYNSTGKKIDLYEEEVIVMPKFDGCSCVFEFDCNGKLSRALTRGNTDTNEAQDITHIFINSGIKPPIKSSNEVGLKTEVMILDSDLEEVNNMSVRPYKNTRSLCSSITNSDECDGREKFLKIIPLRFTELIDGKETEQGLPNQVMDYPYLICKLKELDKIRDFAINHKTVRPGYRCDGAVIRLTNPKVQQVLGRKGNKQKFEVAYKFTEETAYSKIIDIDFTTGLFGRITPRAVFEEVKMKGNTIQKASMGSIAVFDDLELSKGDTVKIIYDIIPYVTFDENDPYCKRSGKKPIDRPLLCHECGKLLDTSDNGGILYCNNDKCPSRVRGKILNYCKKMDIANISYNTIEDLYFEGFLRGIEDLYDLQNHVNQISQMSGYGVKKIQKILDEINSHREVVPSLLLGSIGIEGISVKTFKKVLDYVGVHEILEICEEDNHNFFTVIPGIKDKSARRIVKGINENRNLIDFLLVELNVLPEPKSSSKDFSVVFTKVRDEELEKFIEENNGEVSDSLTKSTSFVVTPVKGTKSSKVSKAEQYGIPIITKDEVKDYIIKTFK